MLALQQAQEEILRMQSDFDLHCGELERRAVDAEQRLELKNVLCLKLDVDLKRSEAALQALYPELNLLRDELRQVRGQTERSQLETVKLATAQPKSGKKKDNDHDFL